MCTSSGSKTPPANVSISLSIVLPCGGHLTFFAGGGKHRACGQRRGRHRTEAEVAQFRKKPTQFGIQSAPRKVAGRTIMIGDANLSRRAVLRGTAAAGALALSRGALAAPAPRLPARGNFVIGNAYVMTMEPD